MQKRQGLKCNGGKDWNAMVARTEMQAWQGLKWKNVGAAKFTSLTVNGKAALKEAAEKMEAQC
eukprot:5651936-Pleurochrysis_carterae.AAC.1